MSNSAIDLFKLGYNVRSKQELLIMQIFFITQV